MNHIPQILEDIGYVDIRQYAISRCRYLNSNLHLHFINKITKIEEFAIKLEGVVAFNDKSNRENLSFIRIDSDGSSYGFDIALRLARPEIEKYRVLYIFEDEKHSSFVLRGIAENILVVPPDDSII